MAAVNPLTESNLTNYAKLFAQKHGLSDRLAGYHVATALHEERSRQLREIYDWLNAQFGEYPTYDFDYGDPDDPNADRLDISREGAAAAYADAEGVTARERSGAGGGGGDANGMVVNDEAGEPLVYTEPAANGATYGGGGAEAAMAAETGGADGSAGTGDAVEAAEAAAAGTGTAELSEEARETLTGMRDILDEMGELSAQSASLKTDTEEGEVRVTDEMRAANQARFDELRGELNELADEAEEMGFDFSAAMEELDEVDLTTREGGREALNPVFDTLHEVKGVLNPPEPEVVEEPAEEPVAADPIIEKNPDWEFSYDPDNRGNYSYVWVD